MKYFKQSHGYSCGPACARMMLGEMGIDAPEKELIEVMDSASGRGTPMENWSKLSAKYAVEVIARQPGCLEELEELRKSGWHITVLILADVPHYLVYLGRKNGRIYMHDPWNKPHYSLLERNLLKKWEIQPDKWRPDSIYISNRWFVALRKQ